MLGQASGVLRTKTKGVPWATPLCSSRVEGGFVGRSGFFFNPH